MLLPVNPTLLYSLNHPTNKRLQQPQSQLSENHRNPIHRYPLTPTSLATVCIPEAATLPADYPLSLRILHTLSQHLATSQSSNKRMPFRDAIREMSGFHRDEVTTPNPPIASSIPASSSSSPPRSSGGGRGMMDRMADAGGNLRLRRNEMKLRPEDPYLSCGSFYCCPRCLRQNSLLTGWMIRL